ncbi:dTDP-4-dehydrorhamnose reductase [Pseudomonas baltica]|uniref:dTDP-4-dehydrorhamnose reductase n=1 Tax=Pseudomonas baltica TaxID=2762576 RepID=UPI0028A26EE6|nr:dTDP-4-dehydrorhamnose reductase [Pseudomonas baltica]
MKILLLGKNGQVGWELQRSLTPLGELVSLDRHSTDYCGNLADRDGLRHTLQTLKPDVIVNAAAYTAVDKAETDRDTAMLINGLAPQVMAQEAQRSGALLVHYSTDYVFDGRGVDPWAESAVASPVNYYGQTKLAGEQAILASGCQHLILRTSWVYGARGSNFAKTMLRLAAERDTLNVIADQHGAPTSAELLADVTAHAITATLRQPALSGLYHLVPSGETSWHAYAQFVLDFARAQGKPLKTATVTPIPTSAYPTPAARPLNSRLSNQKLQQAFGLHLPQWQGGVERMLAELS